MIPPSFLFILFTPAILLIISKHDREDYFLNLVFMAYYTALYSFCLYLIAQSALQIYLILSS